MALPLSTTAVARTSNASPRRRFNPATLATHLILTIASLSILAPVLWTARTSFATKDLAYRPAKLNFAPTLTNYRDIFIDDTFLTYLWNSLWIAVASALVCLVIGVDAWHKTSLLLVILLAGLTALPKEPMEAATVDGANRWQILTTITLPLLAPVMLVAVLIRMIAAMKTYDLIHILTAGATETISYRIWKVGFTNLDMGRASAASILLLLVILAMTLILIRVIQPNSDQ